MTRIPTYFSWTAILLAVGLLALTACDRAEYYNNPVPKLTFESMEVFYQGTNVDSVSLTFAFADGDGDLGLGPQDTTGYFHPDSKYYKNLYVEYYEFYNGDFNQVTPPFRPFDTVSFSFRVPVLAQDSRGKSIKGSITVAIILDQPPFYNNLMKFKAYMYDRSLNKSNVIETPPFSR